MHLLDLRPKILANNILQKRSTKKRSNFALEGTSRGTIINILFIFIEIGSEIRDAHCYCVENRVQRAVLSACLLDWLPCNHSY